MLSARGKEMIDPTHIVVLCFKIRTVEMKIELAS